MAEESVVDVSLIPEETEEEEFVRVHVVCARFEIFLLLFSPLTNITILRE